jgi:glycosyltransferase EpsD
MAKVLVTAHLGRHFRIFGHYDYKVLLKMGHEVHIAANFIEEIDYFEDDKIYKHQIDFDRNPFSMQNFTAMRQLEKLLDDVHFDIIHTQSPSGGVVTRFAARKTRKRGTKIIYTPHGFHFFNGAPLKNWLLYYNIEKFLGYFTDTIITINDEDFKNASRKLTVNDVRLIHGVGIDLDKFRPETNGKKIELRKKYGYTEHDFILVYAGELSYRKHQDMLIDVISIVKEQIPKIKLLLAGVGIMSEHYMQYAKELGVEENVHFLGYRKDITNLMLISDIAVSSSRQEGLPVNIMEAMATGLPLVVTGCRGNRDLVDDRANGFIVNLDDIESFANSVTDLYNSEELRNSFAKESLRLIKKYSINNVTKEMEDIYENVISK